MRRTTTTLVSVLLALSVAGFGIRAQELLTNPGFEQGANTSPWDATIPPTGWKKYGNWGWAGWKNNRPAHAGTKFVDAGARDYGEYGVWYQDISVSPSRVYLCSVWAMTEGWGSDPHASMTIEFRNASNAVLASDSLDIFAGSVPSPNVWTEYVLTTGSAPAETAYARFMLRGEARCTAMFDDASVVSAEATTDFNNDGVVDFRDYAEIAAAWLRDANTPAIEPYDLDDNDQVDAGDVKIFAQDWLRCDAYVTIALDPDVVFQEMDGFGASLTESSAVVMSNALTEARRDALMLELFDPDIGIGLSYLRQPIGASDFRLADYTYDDVSEPDYDLDYFSIDHDRLYVIPLLKQALAISPDINIMGSPWSPPAWMKTSGRLGYGRLIDSDLIYNSCADYFVKYVQAYAAEGLVIDAVTLQNEPHHEPYSYPGMRMEPEDQARLVIKLGPKFLANGIATKIVIWDHNWDEPDYPIAVLNDPLANPYIAGSAFHAYAGVGSAQLVVVAAHPDKDIYFTEFSGGEWASNFGDNLIWDTSRLIIRAVRNYAKTVVKWNLALDENHGPKIAGGCSNCRGVVTIDQSTGEITREVEYYSLGHAAKFVRPGARRIESTESPGLNIENVAFVNADGSTVVIVLNPNAFRQTIRITCKGSSIIERLPGRSVTTLKWADDSFCDLEVWMTTADQTKLLERQSSATDHLTAHWPLDESMGGIAHDAVGSNDGELHGGPTWWATDGSIAGALELDGVDDYVSTGFVIDPADRHFSVFVWVKGGAADQVVLSQTDGTGNGWNWLALDSAGKLMTDLRAPAGRIFGPPLFSDFLVADEQWHHIGLIWDGAYRSLWADESMVAQDAEIQAGLVSADGGLYFGAGKTLDPASFFEGFIDDIRIDSLESQAFTLAGSGADQAAIRHYKSHNIQE